METLHLTRSIRNIERVELVSAPTTEQYMAAVGKVIKILPDGRAPS